MANRFFNQFLFGLEKGRVQLFGSVAIGATGAPTLNVAKSKGIKSIIRNGSAGDYLITLQDAYQRVLSFDPVFKTAAGAAPAANTVVIKADSVNSATPTFEIVCYGATNSSTTTLIPTDPANGEELRFELNLSNSTAV